MVLVHSFQFFIFVLHEVDWIFLYMYIFIYLYIFLYPYSGPCIYLRAILKEMLKGVGFY